eukprot:7267990-Prymnesium_polylepis.2
MVASVKRSCWQSSTSAVAADGCADDGVATTPVHGTVSGRAPAPTMAHASAPAPVAVACCLGAIRRRHVQPGYFRDAPEC